MRFLFEYKIKSIISLLIATAVIFVAVIFSVCPFTKENSVEKEYYLYSVSSQAEMREPNLWEVVFVKGEKAEYVFSNGEEVEKFVEYVKENYSVSYGFNEEIDGTVSLYAYSKKLGDTVVVYGTPVNLHIAIKGNHVALGTPIIFGGY